ncbi:MAG: MurT ligase domain-containing protein [Oscillospiraceae bacterium]|nr:MurT ligase domain-containing protein [Oscillospiraceae bacterium]
MRSFGTAAAMAAAGAIRFALRFLGKGATTLPGKVAIRIAPDFLNEMSRGKNIIMVTGTNGKTTTTHMISEILKKAGYSVGTNVSGANLASGLATVFAEHAPAERAAGRKGIPTAYVLETDEAAFAVTAGRINPKVCVVTNLFRDQLDRFGELLYTRSCIEKGLDATDSKVLLNADDSMIAALRNGRENRVAFFGADEAHMMSNNVTKAAEPATLPSSSDAEYCLKCKVKFEYSARSFGHFGMYRCPSCGDHRQTPDFSAYTEGSTFEPGAPLILTGEGARASSSLSIPGAHNVYNAAAAIGACVLFGKEAGDETLTLPFCAEVLSLVRPAFGRMEKIMVGEKSFCILLVKNPVGLDRALTHISEATDVGGVYLLLNSNIADGTDVSWIWDVDFESRKFPDQTYVSGERYAEMLLRLVYSKAVPDTVKSAEMKRSEALFEEALAACPDGKCLYVLPNYTAMLSLRKYLVGRFRLKNYWK